MSIGLFFIHDHYFASGLVHTYQLEITVKQGRDKVRELFMKNAHATDPRIIDLLVIKVRQIILVLNP